MNIKFLVAEGFRQEVGNKVTAVGLFPDNKIIINLESHISGNKNDNNLPYGIEKLAFLFNISGKQGDYQVDCSLKDPKSKPHGKASEKSKITIVKDHSHNYLIQIAPFIFSIPGTYIFTLKLNRKTYEFPFELITKFS